MWHNAGWAWVMHVIGRRRSVLSRRLSVFSLPRSMLGRAKILLGEERQYYEILPDVITQYGEALRKGVKHVMQVRYNGSVPWPCNTSSHNCLGTRRHIYRVTVPDEQCPWPESLPAKCRLPNP